MMIEDWRTLVISCSWGALVVSVQDCPDYLALLVTPFSNGLDKSTCTGSCFVQHCMFVLSSQLPLPTTCQLISGMVTTTIQVHC